MHNSAGGERGRSRVLEYREAPSSTTPAAVTQERSGWGERKKGRADSEVWVSSTSTNQRVHGTQTCSSIRSRPLIRWKRSSISMAHGGEPAKVATRATSTSRREKALYMDGR